MSMFDPCSVFDMPLKWLFTVMVVLIVPTCYWHVSSGMMGVISYMKSVLFESLKELFANYKDFMLLLLSLFLLVFSSNLVGLSPFVFTVSSHLVYSFSFSFPLWLGGVIYSLRFSWEKVMAHLTPLGSPFVLAPFLVVIELVSLVIRPMSLGVRLMANMTAGHMIMALVEQWSVASLNNLVLSGLISVLILFELGVAMIQAYVFMSLMSLYFEESNSQFN
uniref:ATP synthase subunit a n=1 Tax=Haematopinus asini TaxID=1461129 RepID=A0A059TCM3_9NEOP|nr:ATP synthase F0 subunit 6 [Haematopinus asini]AHY04291.1 ATP synthase F0 subunit 6 [Haematopinus asini]